MKREYPRFGTWEQVINKKADKNVEVLKPKKYTPSYKAKKSKWDPNSKPGVYTTVAQLSHWAHNK